ncbi:RNA polymerase sigma factor [Asticcacaulis solisilvae]|uniref:RNA polymerase sigma factor n=1 Tax=Asticcacaulis solisilvae TaxID=1217274 RepID=UPI003FD85F5C
MREVDEWFASRLFPYERTLVRIAYRITGDEELAREIVHEVYADMFKGERWRAIARPKAYAAIAVRRAAVRLCRRALVVPFKSFADMDMLVGHEIEPDPHQILFVKEQRRIVLEIIDALPPRCREVVRLRRFGDRSPQSIAEQLGITVSVVDKHLARGMAIIARKLSCLDSNE